MKDKLQNLEFLSSRLIPVKEAADLMKMHPGTLRNWLSEGKNFKRIKAGGKTFLDRIDLEKWLEEALEAK